MLSHLELMSQTVAAALRSRGAEADDRLWRFGDSHGADDLSEDDIVLLLDDLNDVESAAAAQALIWRSRARVVVLTEAPEGPVWGALLASGAEAVMPMQASLDAVTTVLRRVGRGQSSMVESKRAQLEGDWERWSAEDDELRARMDKLSARELTVIELLARGRTVAEIGSDLSVAESTVRSHSKALRRKLQVDSQLAAVAVVHRLAGAAGGFRPVVPRPRQPEAPRAPQ